MNNLRNLRKEKRLTQQEMAKFLGISQNAYSYWENDKVKIDNKSLEKLSEFFGVSVDYLLGRSDNDVYISDFANIFPITKSRAKNINNSVGSRIKQLRTSRNITQKELAEVLHKSESAVRMWELDKSEPDIETLKYISDFFNVSVDHLLGHEVPMRRIAMFRLKLKELRENKGLSQYTFADAFGVSQSTVGGWESGTRRPNVETMKKIAAFFEVTVAYLLDEEEASSVSGTSYDNIFPITKKRFPLVGEIACGKPVFADENRESYVVSGTDVQADFCLRAKGDSMIGARILDGDIVFIKEMPMVSNGEIAAVIIGDEATLKRVYYYPEKAKLMLVAENPKYEPLMFEGEELNTVRILGKAIAFQSDVR